MDGIISSCATAHASVIAAASRTKPPALQPSRTMAALTSLLLDGSMRLLTTTKMAYGAGAHLEAIERFRYGIYVQEMGKRLPYAQHDQLRLPDPYDDTAHHLFALDRRGNLVGCVRLHMAPTLPGEFLDAMKLGAFAKAYDRPFGYVSKLMVRRSSRGLGVALGLMKAMVRLGHTDPFRGEVAFFHCRQRLVSLYERMGLRTFGEPFDDPYVGLQVPMFILGGDVEHFTLCRSPLLSVARRFPLAFERKAKLLAALPRPAYQPERGLS